MLLPPYAYALFVIEFGLYFEVVSFDSKWFEAVYTSTYHVHVVVQWVKRHIRIVSPASPLLVEGLHDEIPTVSFSVNDHVTQYGVKSIIHRFPGFQIPPRPMESVESLVVLRREQALRYAEYLRKRTKLSGSLDQPSSPSWPLAERLNVLANGCSRLT